MAPGKRECTVFEGFGPWPHDLIYCISFGLFGLKTRVDNTHNPEDVLPTRIKTRIIRMPQPKKTLLHKRNH